MLFAAVMLTLAAAGFWASGSSEVAALMPFFFVAITLQFLPMFWPNDPDPFSPAALAAVLYGPELVGEALQAVTSGELRFPYLEDLPHSERLELLQKGLSLWILCSAFYLTGFYLGAGRKRIARIFPRVSGLAWNRTRMGLASAACFGAFLITYTFFQNRIGAPLTDVTALAQGKAVWRDDASLTWLGRGILLGFIPLLFWVASVSERPSRRNVVLVVLACVVMALLATRLGQRGYGLMFGFSILIIIHNVYRRFRLTTLAVLALVALVGVQIMGEWRRAAPETASTIRPSLAARLASPERVLASYASDRNRIPVLATVMYYIPDRQDYLMGESFLALLGAPIPKWIWPEKQDVFKWRDTVIVGRLHGIPGPTPLQGVLYANFSWIGAAVGMFLWGLFQRGLYEWLLEDRHDKNRALLYAGMVLYLLPSSLALASTLQYVVPVWAIIRFVGWRSRRRTSPAPSPVAKRLALASSTSATTAPQ